MMMMMMMMMMTMSMMMHDVVEETGSGLLPCPFRSQIDKYSDAQIKFALIEYYLNGAQLPLVTRRVQYNKQPLVHSNYRRGLEIIRKQN